MTYPISPSDIVSRLKQRIELLEEENRSLKEALMPSDHPYHSPVPGLRLTPQLADLLAVLMAKREVPHRAALAAIKIRSFRGGYETEEFEDAAVKVAISRLRKALAPHGVSVINLYARCYMIPEEDKKKVRALFAAENVAENLSS